MLTIKIASILLAVWFGYVATAVYHRPQPIQHQIKLDPLNSYAKPNPAWV